MLTNVLFQPIESYPHQRNDSFGHSFVLSDLELDLFDKSELDDTIKIGQDR